MRRRLDEIIAKHTGQPFEKVAKDTERDYFMSAEEAKEYKHRRPGDRAPLAARFTGLATNLSFAAPMAAKPGFALKSLLTDKRPRETPGPSVAAPGLGG